MRRKCQPAISCNRPNISRTLEQRLSEIVRRRSQWLAENKGALDEYKPPYRITRNIQRRPAVVLMSQWID